MLDSGLGAIERAFEIDRDYRVPILFRHGQDQPVARNAGIVHEDMQIPKCIQRELYEILGLTKNRNVCLETIGLSPEFLDFTTYNTFARLVVYYHGRAAAGQFVGNSSTDAAPTTRHEATRFSNDKVIFDSLIEIIHHASEIRTIMLQA